jgi:hypothetical protein
VVAGGAAYTPRMHPTAPPPPPALPSYNAFQRRYFAWAQPYYDRMDPAMRAEAMRIDQFLYSARGLGFWLGLLGALAGSTVGLKAAGFPWSLALVCSLAVWIALIGAGASAWLRPQQFGLPRLLRAGLLAVALAYAGALTGFLVARSTRDGGIDPERLGAALWAATQRAAPVLLLGALALVAVMAMAAQLRRQQLGRELDRLRLVQERDAAARQAAEARLALLQAQIQPHFIFNTLAALQHWVDEGDARAAPLLRSLAGFLRGSTELLAQDAAPLGNELPLVRHYLAVMQARLGDRLRATVEADAACAAVALPPGLLLTLVENAVEHGAGARLQGGEVQVRASLDGGRCRIEVSDNGPGLAPGWREGVGLANARERLAHRFGPRARLRLEPLEPPADGTRAVIEIDLDEARDAR